MYLNKFDINNMEKSSVDTLTSVTDEDSSENEDNTTDEGIINYSEQFGSGFYTVNNRKANNLNIIAKNYFEDLSSTSSYEEIQEASQYGGDSSSLDSDSVIRIKSFLIP